MFKLDNLVIKIKHNTWGGGAHVISQNPTSNPKTSRVLMWIWQSHLFFGWVNFFLANLYRLSILHKENRSISLVICIFYKKKRKKEKDTEYAGVWMCIGQCMCVWDTWGMCEAHHHSQPGHLFIWINTAFLMAIPRDKHLLIWKQAKWLTSFYNWKG